MFISLSGGWVLSPFVIVVVIVLTIIHSFYPTTSAVNPMPVLILHPREVQNMWSQTVRNRNQKTIAN